MSDSFTHLLKTWRKNKRLTQQKLAEEAGTTSRIVSFLETGKEKPTRQMTDRLSKALKLSYQSHFDFVQAAGFQPSKEEVKHQKYYQEVKEAADLIVRNHEPFPALVIDSNYHVLSVNKGFHNSFEFFTDLKFDDSWLPQSLLKIVYTPGSIGDFFTSRDESAKFLVQRLHRENLSKGTPLDLKGFRDEHPFFSDDIVNYDETYIPSPQLIINAPKDDVLYTTSSVIVTVGLPHDLGGDTIRVVLIFPKNQASEELYEQWREY